MLIQNVWKLKPEKLLSSKAWTSIAENAKRDADLIQKRYAKEFGITQKRIVVWMDRDGKNKEYLTKDLIWQARYENDRSYNIRCEIYHIYKYYVAEYFINNNLITPENKDYPRIYEMFEACKYFRNFVRDINLNK